MGLIGITVMKLVMLQCECGSKNRGGFGEFVLPSVQKQAERKSSTKTST